MQNAGRASRSAFVLAIVGVIVGCQSQKRAPSTMQAATRNRAAIGDSQIARTGAGNLPTAPNVQIVALFSGPMPTGVAVSKRGRIFVCFPRWGDSVDFTVAELEGDDAVAYPDIAINTLSLDSQAHDLVSVQSVVIDSKDRLWLLDTGSINMQPIKPGAAKLLCYDLETNRLVKRITFPSDVAFPTTYLNDVRFNLSIGEEGVAIISDSSDQGPNGFIVVDLASGKSWRKLNNHPSTRADQNFVPTVEGDPLVIRPGIGKPNAFLKVGLDGIAISHDGKTLFYCALATRRLYSVSVAALADGRMSDEDTARTVQFLGNREFASDGLRCDPAGNLLLTDYEHNAIRRRLATADIDGDCSIVAQDARMIWPDTMALDPAGNDLYVIANQLNRQPKFQEGRDLRRPPYVLFRVRLGAFMRRTSSTRP